VFIRTDTIFNWLGLLVL